MAGLFLNKNFMDILRLNTSPTFEIVPRVDLNTGAGYNMRLTNEMTSEFQFIVCLTTLLPNENYLLTMGEFPNGKQGDKFYYSLEHGLTDEIVLRGKLMIVSETESVQDYSKQSNNKFYN